MASTHEANHDTNHDSAHEHGPNCSHGDHGDHAHSHTDGSLASHDAEDVICLHNVSYRFPSVSARQEGVLALRDITLHIARGENLGIIGPNGAGKTTLLRIMLGQLTDYQGSVDIMGLSPKLACRRGDVVGYVPQRADVEWRFPVSGEQVVNMGLTGKTGLFKRFSKADRAYGRELIERVGMSQFADHPIGDLSGGQQQRLFIARALVAKPTVLILDEPLVGIDEAGQAQFAEFIHELHESLGLTIIVVSHDLQAVAAGCNKVACLNQTLHYHDSPTGLTRDVLSEVFAHDIAPVLAREKAKQ